MNRLILDLKAALTALRRRPGFTALAVLTLAVGLGPTTAILSILSGVLLSPYPYENPEEIVRVWSMNRPQSIFGRDLSYPDYLDLKEGNEALESMAIADSTAFDVELGDETRTVSGARVSADLFPLVGATAARGRLFSEADDTWGAPPVAIVSHELWQRQLGGDPDVVGSVLDVDGQPHSVVGILAPEIKFPDQADLFVPLALDPNRERRDDRSYLTLGRLAPGVGPMQAATQLGREPSRVPPGVT